MVDSGVKVIALLALSGNGAPGYDHDIAARFSSMGIPSFACTPDLFPDFDGRCYEGRRSAAFASRARAAENSLDKP